MASSNSLGPKYGEKGALMRNYRQRHQPPVQLQRAIGNDRRCMEMCPSPGLHVDRLGDRADPLPPKRKKRYEQHKARIQAVKAGAIQSRKRQVEGGRKMAAKKPPPVENTTPPPEQPPQLRNTFRIARPPPLPQLSAARSTASDDRRTSSPFDPGHALAPSTSVWWVGRSHSTGPASAVDPMNSPLPAAKSDQKPGALDSACYYFEFSAAPQPRHATLSHVRSQANAPSLGPDSDTLSMAQSPGTSCPGGTTPTTPPSSYAAAGLDGTMFMEKQGADSEGLSNTVCESSFIPGSSRNRISLEREQEYANALSAILKTAPLSCNAGEQNPEFLSLPLRPALKDPLDVQTRGPTTMETAVWNSTHPGQHFGHRNVLTIASPEVQRAHRRRTPASRNASRVGGAPGERHPGHATHDRHATRPYPSPSNRLAAGHGHHNHFLGTAETSVATQSAGYWTTPPTATATVPREAEVSQHDGYAIGTFAPHDNPYCLSTRTSLPHAHSVQTSAIQLAANPHASLVNVNWVNHHGSGVSAAMNMEYSQLASRSMSAYSEPTHAPIGDYMPAMPAGIGAATFDKPLYSPQIADVETTSRSTRAPELLAHWHSDHPVASDPIIIDPESDAAVAAAISRAHSANNTGMTRAFEGRFEECEPFWPNTMVPLLDTDFAIGQGPGETYLDDPLTSSQNDPCQQFLTTSTWQDAYSGILPISAPPYRPTTDFVSAPMLRRD